MKGDFTRNTFKKDNHYTSVRMQQGRVLLDADWNEQVDIQNYRHETEAADVIGGCGVPKTRENDGFKLIANSGTIAISKGRIYVDGILCENEQQVAYENQPAYDGTPLPTVVGPYLFYLDVWQLHVTAVEDPSISETALNGVDTTTRLKTVWQVRYLELPERETLINFCGKEFDNWTRLIEEKSARLMASISGETDTVAPGDACSVSPITGYRGAENQLYRVEIHTPGSSGSATFKWSRDNSMLAAAIIEIKDNDSIIIEQPGRDELHRFNPGDWIEVTDDFHELGFKPGALVRLKSILNGVELVFDPATATKDIVAGNFYRNPKVRRWNQTDTAEIKTSAGIWLPLEDGIEVSFGSNDTYQTGDYWLIPARTTTRGIEWPLDEAGNLKLQQRQGIKHHFCRLGILTLDKNGKWSHNHDCRQFFSPLVEQRNMFYVSGDGQEGFAGKKLPKPLVVGVTNGQLRIRGARINFKIITPGGHLHLTADSAPGSNVRELNIVTDANGLAACYYELDDEEEEEEEDNEEEEEENNVGQQIEATLLDAAGEPSHLPVRFNANISSATGVAVTLLPCNDSNLVRPSIHSLFCDATEESLNLWPDLDDDKTVTVQDIVDGLLFHLDASKLPFKHLGGPGNFPTDMEQIVSAALNHLSVHLIPAGMIMAFANETPPPGWLECNGQELSRDAFATLYAAIGDRFGTDDDSNTFQVPDLRGEFIRGWDHGKNVDPQRKFGDSQQDQIQTHTHSDAGHTHVDSGHEHSINDPGHSHQAPTTTGTAGEFEADPDIRVGYDYDFAAPTSVASTGITINTASANIQSSTASLGEPKEFGTSGPTRHGTETRPRNIALMYCIKF